MNNTTDFMTKQCGNCKKKLPATSKYFYKRGKGFRLPCKECISESNKKYNQENKEEISEYHKLYREKNGDKLKKKYEENKSRHRKWNKEWRSRNRERALRKQREYRQENKDVTKAWWDAHPHKREEYKQKRRAKIEGLEHTFTSKQWMEKKQHFNDKCAYCGKKKKLTQDHFIPLSHRGEYTHNNIIPACGSCNSSKGNRDFFDWYPNFKDYSKVRENRILKHLNHKDDTQQLSIFY